MASQSFIPATQTALPIQAVSTKTYNYGYYPLLKGDIAPVFQLHKEAFVSTQHFLNLQQLLVIAFHGNLYKNEKAVAQLKNQQLQVQQAGGNLIVLSNGPAGGFRKNISQLSNLNIFTDADNGIAELFGLYDFANPLSNWLSGVDDSSVPLPALYVIAPDRQITFSYIDYHFDFFKQASLPKEVLENLLTAVANIERAYTYANIRLKKLVS